MRCAAGLDYLTSRCSGRVVVMGLSRLVPATLVRREQTAPFSDLLLPDYLNKQLKEQLKTGAQKEAVVEETKEPHFPSAPSRMKDRSLAKVALQRAEPLERMKAHQEPPRPMPSRLVPAAGPEMLKVLSRITVPTEVQEEVESESEQPELKPRQPKRQWDHTKVKLQVLPEHRRNLRLYICKQILHDCMIRLRNLQGISSHEPPLWLWEYGMAIRLAELRGSGDPRDQMKMLARFLAQKQLHIMHGPLRQVFVPGRHEWSEDRQREVFQEYFTLLAQLSRAVPGYVAEDQFFRSFLDGKLDWDEVLRLLDVDLSRRL